MKTFRIKPGIHKETTQIWILEERKGWLKWVKVYKNEDIMLVKRMKDHLLQRITYYNSKNNKPITPLRTSPSKWLAKPKLKRLKIKRSELPDSFKH